MYFVDVCCLIVIDGMEDVVIGVIEYYDVGVIVVVDDYWLGM